MDKWTDIEDLINRWSKRFPEKMAENLEWIKEAKESNKNDFGTSEEGALRVGTLVHPELYGYIREFHPDFLDTNEDVRGFVKRFKKFQVPHKY